MSSPPVCAKTKLSRLGHALLTRDLHALAIATRHIVVVEVVTRHDELGG